MGKVTTKKLDLPQINRSIEHLYLVNYFQDDTQAVKCNLLAVNKNAILLRQFGRRRIGFPIGY